MAVSQMLTRRHTCGVSAQTTVTPAALKYHQPAEARANSDLGIAPEVMIYGSHRALVQKVWKKDAAHASTPNLGQGACQTQDNAAVPAHGHCFASTLEY